MPRRKKTARVLNGKAGASAPPRHSCSCHCAHGRKTKEDDRQGARHGCPAAASMKYVAAGVPVQLRFPRHRIHGACHGGRVRPVMSAPLLHQPHPRRACPPRHVCPAAASAVPDGVKRTKWKQMQRVTAETLRLPVAFCSRRAHWSARLKQRVPRLLCRRIHELHHGRRIRSATAALPPYPQRVMDAACIPPPERLQNPSFFHKYLQNPAGRRIIRRNDHKVPVRVNDKEGIYHGGSCF